MEQEKQCRQCSWYARVRCVGREMYRPGMFGCATFRKYTSQMMALKEYDRNFWATKMDEKMLESVIERWEAEEASREVPRWMAGA
jgi:hypothetical protein